MRGCLRVRIPKKELARCKVTRWAALPAPASRYSTRRETIGVKLIHGTG
jgi:hypothetical protein